MKDKKKTTKADLKKISGGVGSGDSGSRPSDSTGSRPTPPKGSPSKL